MNVAVEKTPNSDSVGRELIMKVNRSLDSENLEKKKKFIRNCCLKESFHA